ncbi:MAG: two component transcriptional regulator, LuxR family [Chthoniobacteraceae bacterium]|nr:two component transcriptional regulator, LuxR family [Chthoniobacteraceae bacterium]
MMVKPEGTLNDTEINGRQKRILIVDDHPLFRHGITRLIGSQTKFMICGEASDALAALDCIRSLEPDLVLLDISLNGTSGIELIKPMLTERPSLLIVVLSMHDESAHALKAMRTGARGFVVKSEAAAQIVVALDKVFDGQTYISPVVATRRVFKEIESLENGSASPLKKLSSRELEVLLLFGKALRTREIAGRLGLSVKTVETHRMHIIEKLRFRDASEMVRFAVDWVSQQLAE